MPAEIPQNGPPRRRRGSRWRAVAALATAQRGYVSREQLRQAGLDWHAIRRAVRDGRLYPRRHGLFLVGHRHRAPGATWHAALLLGGPGCVLSHQTAGELWGLLPAGQPLHVTSAVRWRRRPPVTVHRAVLPRSDRPTRHGFPVTTLVRTIVDLAAVLGEARLDRAVNEAAIRGWLHARNVAAVLALARGRRGAAALRRVLAARDRSQGWTRSRLERAFADLVREAGLPRYERGLLVDIGDGDLRECDAVWREARVMVELDWLPIHESGRVPYRDRRRDRRLAAAGWIVIRLTGHDLTHHRDELLADLRRALRSPAGARRAA